MVRQMTEGKYPAARILHRRVDQNIDVFRGAIESMSGDGITADQGVFNVCVIKIFDEGLQILPGGRTCVISHVHSVWRASPRASRVRDRVSFPRDFDKQRCPWARVCGKSDWRP